MSEHGASGFRPRWWTRLFTRAVDLDKASGDKLQSRIKELRQQRTGIWINPAWVPPHDADWALMKAHKFAEAAERFGQRAAETKNPLPFLRNRALALLNLGLYREAHDAFQEIDRAETQRQPLHDRALAEMGVCLWLADQREDALPLILENLELRTQNKLAYGDFAGGAWEGLIALYVGVSLPNENVRAKALRHLRTIADGKRRNSWPGPIARYLVDEASLEDILLEAAEARDVNTAIVHARVDTLARRQLTEALFYAACKYRGAGDEQRCLEMMVKAASLPPVYIELEWYLARHEVARHRAHF